MKNGTKYGIKKGKPQSKIVSQINANPLLNKLAIKRVLNQSLSKNQID